MIYRHHNYFSDFDSKTMHDDGFNGVTITHAPIGSPTDYGESNTDKESYSPVLEGSSGYRTGESPNAASPSDFDFPDGVDSGSRVPYIAQPSLDITEFDKMKERFEKQIISDAQAREDEKNEKISESMKGNDNASETSSNSTPTE